MFQKSDISIMIRKSSKSKQKALGTAKVGGEKGGGARWLLPVAGTWSQEWTPPAAAETP
jgi:hypothetical protein